MENFSRKRKLSTDTENHSSQTIADRNVYPCFLPGDHCINHICDWIYSSKKSIIVQAYRFRSKAIGNALKYCAKIGVEVKILIDKGAWNSCIEDLKNYGIEIQVDMHCGKAHNKIIIIDDDYVITGSYNFVDKDDYCDSDTVVFIKDACVNKKFKEHYECINLENQSLIQRAFSYGSKAFGKIVSYLLFGQRNANVPVEMYNFNIRMMWGCGECNVPLLSRNTATDNEGFNVVANKNTQKKLKRDPTADINVCFPRFNKKDCIDLIVEYIDNAKRSVFIQACSFTHESILDALKRAATRKIDVKILIDKKAFNDIGQKVSDIIKSSGIEVRYDKTCPHGIAHSKTIIIDKDIVLTGSFNLTKSAQNFNLENLLQMRNLILNGIFKEQFYKKWNAGSDEFQEIEYS